MKIAVFLPWYRSLAGFLLCSLISWGLLAQASAWSIGIDGGPVGYAGDLSINNRPLFNGGESALGIQVNWQSPQHWEASLAIRTGNFTGDDYRYPRDLYRLERAFLFQTSFVDLNLMARFHPWPRASFSPYLGAGAGVVWLDVRPDFSRSKVSELSEEIAWDRAARLPGIRPLLPLGMGVVWRLNSRIDLLLAAQVNFTATDYIDGISRAADPGRNDRYGYASLGFKYRLLPTDSDGDGIPNKIDECPDIFGAPSAAGCPDMDGDQVPDAADQCPDQAGMRRFQGCPDSDGDMVPDQEDDCPQQPGWADLNGCPWKDTDQDGTPDYADACPNSVGPVDRQGCPAIDTDTDGLLDEDDLCPEVFGALIFSGCPDTDDDGIEDAKDACPYLFGSIQWAGCPASASVGETVGYFNRQLFVFTPNSDQIKQQKLAESIAALLRENPTYSLRFSSHDDSGFSEEAGQNWALRRAKALYDYWLQQGIDPVRMSYEVLGASQPLSQASTAAARDINRRVNIFLFQ